MVRDRITPPLLLVEDDPRPRAALTLPPSARRTGLLWVRELGRLAVLFLAVAVANVLFLLVALSFVSSGTVQSPSPFAVPGR
jgi:hypothetical protein